ncbi:MAG: GAF domain-containing protein, partial [Deltaproteobacteria bacterium]|nr:GAF domain-containing protein [Deltaproteobacteria bacterium]
MLRSVAAMLSRPVTTDHVLRAMVDAVVEALEAERGTLYLRDARTGELCSKVAHLPELREIRLPPGRGLAGRVAESGEIVLRDDVRADQGFFAGIDEQTGYRTRSMLAVPVKDDRGGVCGVLQVLHRRAGAFDARDRKLIVELAAQVAEALARTSMRPEGDRGLVLDAPFSTIIGSSPAMLDLYGR